MDAAPSSQHSAAMVSGSQIRSRITVVCAECKRLKLKCDRRAPCGSCVKRETVSRCVYSAAAAEKIDVQSLHNRVLLLEAQLQTLSGGRLRLATQPGLDRALVAITGGSSILVNLEDIAAIWLEQLDLHKDVNFRAVQERDPTRFFDANAFPDLNMFRLPDSDLPGVSQQLLDLLPPENMREVLMTELEGVMLLRPSFNFSHFSIRVHSLFTRHHKSERPTLSFFACVAMGYAIGAQSWLESNKSSAVKTPRSYDPDALHTLADHAIQVYERLDTVHDLDYITALILKVLFLIHDGKPRVSPHVYAVVSKMVSAAREMGLCMDPDDTPGRYSPFEGEMRRRAWWDVYYYDLFISDFLGHVPTIADNSFTTNLPADADDDQFTPQSASVPSPSEYPMRNSSTYFIQKCRLAQLAKNTKKRVFADPKQPALEPSLELAQSCEQEVMTWLTELPSVYKLEPEPDSSLPAYLLAQRCELAMIANSLILKVFQPFCRKSFIGKTGGALTSCTNAAHKIVLAADQLQQRMKGPQHSLAFMSYFFNLQLFHAAVVCANSAIQDPTNVYVKPCMKDLSDAIRIMREPVVPTSRGPMVGGVEGSKSEPLRILELLQKKAEDTCRGSTFGAGTKRKHSEVDEHLQPGFHIPYAGPAIVTSPAHSLSPPPPPGASSSTSQASASRPRHTNTERSIQPATNGWTNSDGSSFRASSTRERAKTQSHVPTVGIRNRHAGGSKYESNSAPGRESVGSSARRSVPPVTSAPPATPQSHSPPDASVVGTPYGGGAPSSGPPSASASGPQPMETSSDFAMSYNEPHSMTNIPGPYPSAYPAPPTTQPPTYATNPAYAPPPSGYYMAPAGHMQYGGPPMQPQPPTFDPSAMNFAMTGPQMETSPTHPQPPSRISSATPGAGHYASGAPQEAEGSGHDSSDSGAFQVQQQWPPAADDGSRYQQWNYDTYS